MLIQYSESERLWWVLRFFEGRNDVTQAVGCPAEGWNADVLGDVTVLYKKPRIMQSLTYLPTREIVLSTFLTLQA